MGLGESEKTKEQRLDFFRHQVDIRSWTLEFKNRRPSGYTDEIAKVNSPDSRLRVCFHLTGEFLTDPNNGWEQKAFDAIEKAESLFTENRDCGDTVKLLLRSAQPFLMEPPRPCK